MGKQKSTDSLVKLQVLQFIDNFNNSLERGDSQHFDLDDYLLPQFNKPLINSRQMASSPFKKHIVNKAITNKLGNNYVNSKKYVIQSNKIQKMVDEKQQHDTQNETLTENQQPIPDKQLIQIHHYQPQVYATNIVKSSQITRSATPSLFKVKSESDLRKMRYDQKLRQLYDTTKEQERPLERTIRHTQSNNGARRWIPKIRQRMSLGTGPNSPSKNTQSQAIVQTNIDDIFQAAKQTNNSHITLSNEKVNTEVLEQNLLETKSTIKYQDQKQQYSYRTTIQPNQVKIIQLKPFQDIKSNLDQHLAYQSRESSKSEQSRFRYLSNNVYMEQKSNNVSDKITSKNINLQLKHDNNDNLFYLTKPIVSSPTMTQLSLELEGSRCNSKHQQKRVIQTSESRRRIKQYLDNFNNQTISDMVQSPKSFDKNKLQKLIKNDQLGDIIAKNQNILSQIQFSTNPQQQQQYNQSSNSMLSFTERIKGKAEIQKNLSKIKNLKQAPLIQARQKLEDFRDILDSNSDFNSKLKLVELKLQISNDDQSVNDNQTLYGLAMNRASSNREYNLYMAHKQMTANQQKMSYY